MKVWITALASALLFGNTTVSFAQSFEDFIKRMPDIAQSGRARLVESEWRKLPATELACITGKLRERGDSIESLSRRAILPSDARVADIRSQCGPARPTETEPVVAQPQLGSVPESAVTELRQTVAALKGNLAESALKIAQLEKEKAQANNAIKQAERDRLDAEHARGEIEQLAAAQKVAFAEIAQLETDKASLDARVYTWKLAAIGAIAALVVCLLTWTFTGSMRSKTAATESKGKSPS